MKDELNFKVSSELKNILGKDLITDDNIAVLELVKNSYDAHATKVELTFEDDMIVIADNGKGMTKNDLINKWLFVGFSAKRDNTEDESYRSNFKRHYAGAKGIGRLSCDRLARYVRLTTKSAESPTLEMIQVDWQAFEKNQTNEFDDIQVEHESMVKTILFPNDSRTGTIIELEGLHRRWRRSDIQHLRHSLEKMINPFQEADDFKIEIKVPSLLSEDIRTKEELSKKDYNCLDNRGKEEYAAKQSGIVNGIIRNTIAGILKIKTTQIESRIEGNHIKTKLSDRGELMYEISEDNKFNRLQNVSISIYFLNRAAKYNFSLLMGMQPINYGNIFLFRNGIRIWPYGEPDDDSWGLNKRSQQGYNRYLGTRDLLGRVDVETDNLEDFKEVSSRDGGLINNESTNQLLDFFTKTHHRLERYVVGVLWGEGFLKNEYFKKESTAKNIRQELQASDKESSDVNAVYNNIGSKVDFLQLIKSLVKDDSVHVLHYNTQLADIINDVDAKDIIRENLFDDLRRVAEKTQNISLLNRIDLYHKKIEELRKEKELAEKEAEQQRLKAKIELQKRKEEEDRRKEAEKQRDAQIQKNHYLSATRNTTQEVQDITHAISVNSNELIKLLSNLMPLISEGIPDRSVLVDKISEASFYAHKIQQLSMLITKADIVKLKNKVRVDIIEYITEYVHNFKSSLGIKVNGNQNKCWKIMSLLDLSIVLDNLISNSKKAGAYNILLTFKMESNKVILDFSDDGVGVDKSVFTSETIFEEGVTNRRGGSGIGLHTVKYTMENKLHGQVCYLNNGLYGMKGATFRLFFL